jgi:hypothetical protein
MNQAAIARGFALVQWTHRLKEDWRLETPAGIDGRRITAGLTAATVAGLAVVLMVA